MKKILSIFILIIILIRPVSIVVTHLNSFFDKGYGNQYSALKYAYENSQYVKKGGAPIPDETFESFVGGAFVRGIDPIRIVHEHPPMGRYIIGFSTLLFDNASTLILPCLFFSILGIFLISKLILKEVWLAFLPVGIFINEPLFLSKITITPLLEAIQLPFIIFSIYFFIKGMESKKKYPWWFLFTSIMLGFVISIRFFTLGAVLLVSFLLTLMVLEKKLSQKFLSFIFALPVSLVILLLAYTKTMQNGYSPIQILGVQKYILAYHSSQLILPFSFFDLLLFNRWHTWWGEKLILHDSVWVITWPVAFVSTVIFLLATFARRIKVGTAQTVVLFWIFFYCLMLSIGNSTTRYFLPLLPFLYILSVAFVQKLMKKSRL